MAAQRADPGSVLNFCRELLRVRREQRGAAGQKVAGDQRLGAPAGTWRYVSGELEVAANLTGEPAGGAWPDGEVLLSTHRAGAGAVSGQSRPPRPLAGTGVLGPWEGVITRRPR